MPDSIRHLFLCVCVAIAILVYSVIVVAILHVQRNKRLKGETIEVTVMSDLIWSTIPFIMLVVMMSPVISMWF